MPNIFMKLISWVKTNKFWTTCIMFRFFLDVYFDFFPSHKLYCILCFVIDFIESIFFHYHGWNHTELQIKMGESDFNVRNNCYKLWQDSFLTSYTLVLWFESQWAPGNQQVCWAWKILKYQSLVLVRMPIFLENIQSLDDIICPFLKAVYRVSSLVTTCLIPAVE